MPRRRHGRLLVEAAEPGAARTDHAQVAACRRASPAAYDAARPGAAVRRPAAGSESQVSRWLGTALARFCAEQGWEFRSLRSRLALVDRSFESYLASKVLLGLLGLLFAPLLLLVLTVSGLHLTVVVPVWAGLGLGGVRKRVKLLGGEVEWREVSPHGIRCRVVIRDLSKAR